MVGCEDADKINLSMERLRADSTIIQFGTNRFVAQVDAIRAYRGRVYLNDARSNQVLCLDNDLSLLHVFGSVGEGPGEFTYAGALLVQNDSIYVYDGGKRRIQIFDLDGTYVRSFQLPAYVHTSFAIDAQDHIYISAHTLEAPIVVLDSQGEQVRRFGHLLGTTDSDTQNRIRSVRFLALDSKGELLAVGRSVPIVERYNLDGTLLHSVDLSTHPLFKGRLAYAERRWEEQQNPRRTVTVVNSIDVVGQILYISIITGQPRKNLQASTLLVLDAETFDIQRIITLNNEDDEALPWIASIGARKHGRLIAFDGKEGIFYTFSNLEF